MKKVFLITLRFVLIALLFPYQQANTTNVQLPLVDMHSVLNHQKELMGRTRIPSSVSESSKADQMIAEYVLSLASQGLPKKYKKNASKIATAIITEANRYNMDPLFITAVIQQESSFNPDQIGTVKEVGLMQVRPETAQWLNKKYHLVKKLNLKDPATNIKIGTFFLSNLRNRFDKNSRHYISAYNMGATKLRQNLRANLNPKEYVQNVMKHYVKYMQDLSIMAQNLNAAEEIENDLIAMPIPVASN